MFCSSFAVTFRRAVWSVVLVVIGVLGCSQSVFAQAGVVIPGNSSTPDVKQLSLAEMSTDIRIDHQYVRVKIVQIYANHTSQVLESKYIFQLPTTGAISDFAVWDGDIRIPGVILEVKRATEIYEELKAQYIDPGLVTQEDEEGGSTAFTVRLTPIPAYGTKRVEMEYTQLLPVEGGQTFFSLPLKPSEYGQQMAGIFSLSLDVMSRIPMSQLNVRSTQYPLAFSVQQPDHIVGAFTGTNVSFGQDFAFDYTLQNTKTELSLLTYRAPEIISPLELRDPNRTKPDNDGYFEIAAVFNERGAKPGEFIKATTEKRSVVILLDTSLSMQWEKLDRAFQATELFLRTLAAQDSFNVLLFNDDVQAFSTTPLTATPENIERALTFIKQSYLSGGTDFVGALKKGLELAKQLPGDERDLILITDGNPTLTTTVSRRMVQDFSTANGSGTKRIARVYAFGIGSDTNQQFLKELARTSRGYFDWGRETDELEFRLTAFFAKVGQKPIEALALTTSDGANVYSVYPDVDTTSYDGSRFSFVGRYRRPAQSITFSLAGDQHGRPIKLAASAALPELDNTHSHLPRMWARQRVDALLRLIALNGEDEALIAEIIALSKKYKFVTPYTAFLAAPRSLLRPRVIKPGDPILRVRTDASIKSVVAVFPFGLTKTLTYLTSEDIWETRFLAPKEMQDGSYACRLILTDDKGNVFQEEKRFVIDSRPPQLKPELAKTLAQAGDSIEIRVAADQDTRRISARLAGTLPVRVIWDPKRKTNIGVIHIPEGVPSGLYTIIVTAEDFAHNVVGSEVTLEVIGG
ncbi:MAG: VWA domain-containing protein [Acidobacteria bacterium]|nr:VWA domain-containing protein [Acidobacteriota bacterium]